MKQEKQIRAVVVDDAAFMRKQLVEILSSSKEIDVVGVARHGKEALEAIDVLKPDVVTLDVDMPVMDGITTIKHIMVKRPVPVVMVSGLSSHGNITFDALRLGAIDFFPKPSGTISEDLAQNSKELISSLKVAARANLKAVKRAIRPKNNPNARGDTSEALSGVMVIWAGQGAISTFIRFISAVGPIENMAFISIHDLPNKILDGFSKELSDICPCSLAGGDRTLLNPGNLILVSEDQVPRVTSNDKGLFLEPYRGKDGLEALFSDLSQRFGEDLYVVILGGRPPENIQFLKKAVTNGANIMALAPEYCTCKELSSIVFKEGLGATMENERLLWERARAISRELRLKGLAKRQGY